MEAAAKSDLFFFITTICVILITVIIIIVGAYIVRVVVDIKYITKRAKKETDEIADDLKEAREHIKEKGMGLMSVLASVFAFRRARKKRKE